MSYKCNEHGWQHLLEPCRSCNYVTNYNHQSPQFSTHQVVSQGYSHIDPQVIKKLDLIIELLNGILLNVPNPSKGEK
jgi:hypothetical protein